MTQSEEIFHHIKTLDQEAQDRIQKWIDLLRAAYRIDETGFSTALAYIGAVLSEEGN